MYMCVKKDVRPGAILPPHRQTAVKGVWWLSNSQKPLFYWKGNRDTKEKSNTFSGAASWLVS